MLVQLMCFRLLRLGHVILNGIFSKNVIFAIFMLPDLSGSCTSEALICAMCICLCEVHQRVTQWILWLAPHPEVGEVSPRPLIPNDSLSTLSRPTWSTTPPMSLLCLVSSPPGCRSLSSLSGRLQDFSVPEPQHREKECGHKVLSVSLPSHEECSATLFLADEIQFFGSPCESSAPGMLGWFWL